MTNLVDLSKIRRQTKGFSRFSVLTVLCTDCITVLCSRHYLEISKHQVGLPPINAFYDGLLYFHECIQKYQASLRDNLVYRKSIVSTQIIKTTSPPVSTSKNTTKCYLSLQQSSCLFLVVSSWNLSSPCEH